MVHNTIIIGAGCAGLTAAIYCGRALLAPLIFADDCENKGGLLVKTSIVENYPGFQDGINGFDIISNMEEQATKYGASIINRCITRIDFSTRPFQLLDNYNDVYLAKTVIICTGSKPNKLGLENEEKFWSNGISSCAVCDGALYRGKKIIVLGGGDSAMEMSLFLTKFSDVILIHRRNEFRASKIMQDRVISNPKINIIYNTIIEHLDGNDKLENIVCRNLLSDEVFTLEVDGLFYGLGLKPNTEIFKDVLEMDEDGYLVKNQLHFKYSTMTSIDGVFVAGDCEDKVYKQAITACGDGCRAALDVIKYLEDNDLIN